MRIINAYNYYSQNGHLRELLLENIPPRQNKHAHLTKQNKSTQKQAANLRAKCELTRWAQLQTYFFLLRINELSVMIWARETGLSKLQFSVECAKVGVILFPAGHGVRWLARCFPMLSDVVRWCPMLSDLLRMLSGNVRRLSVRRLVRCCPMLSDVIRCRPMLYDVVRSWANAFR